MKKIFYIIAGLSLLATTSCKDFLDKEPLARQDEVTAFAEENDATSAVNSIYDPLGWIKTYSVLFWVFGDCMSDDAEVGGYSDDQPEVQAIGLFNIDPYNINFENFFTYIYVGIQRSNTFLAATDPEFNEVNYDDAVLNELRGQAYFMRAFYYFDLLRIFGPVSYIEKIGDDVENRVSGDDNKGSKQVQYLFGEIIEDLEMASELLSAVWEDQIDKGRATKGAAYAMLAKVYAFQASYVKYGVYELDGDATDLWGKARDNADKVIALGVYGLVDDYASLFNDANENGIESIFEIQFIQGTDYGAKDEGTIRSIYQTARAIKGKESGKKDAPGYGWNQPRADYVAMFDVQEADGTIGSWEAGKEYTAWDSRLDMIAKAGDSIQYNPDGEVEQCSFDIKHATAGAATGFWSRKAELAYDKRGDNAQVNGLNYIVYRYADLLLIKAEAEAELGNNGAALSIINDIRERARGEGEIPADLSSATLEDVRAERRRELGMEGHRFFDVVRWGIANDVFGKYTMDSHSRNVNWTPDVNLRMPIPQRVIIENGGKVTQNFGY